MNHANSKISFRTAMCAAVALLALLCGCVSHAPIIRQAPELAGYTAPEVIEDANLLELSPAMQAFLERYVLPYENLDTRLQLLTLAVTQSGIIGFDRDDNRTLTASEAFRQQTGNCLSYANMVLSLARAAGLRANYQEVIVQPQWSSREDTILLAKHINVTISSRHYRYVIDVTGERAPTNATRHVLTDSEAAALYYNNLGVEALLDNRLPSAWALIKKAIDTAPQMSSPWVNMGVIMSRNQQFHEAELAHRNALALNSQELTALSNLYDVYIAMGDEVRAAAVESKVEDYRENNPYYLLMLSNEAFEQGLFEDSAKLLEKAVSRKDDDHALHFALARARFLTGDKADALTAFAKARELAPGEVSAEYQQALEQWVNEDPGGQPD